MSDNPRALIREALAGALSPDQLSKLVDEALASTKTVYATCTRCNKETKVSVPDAKAVVSAIAELVEQGFGRPGTQSGDETGVIEFQRHIHYGPREDGFVGTVVERHKPPWTLHDEAEVEEIPAES